MHQIVITLVPQTMFATAKLKGDGEEKCVECTGIGNNTSEAVGSLLNYPLVQEVLGVKIITGTSEM